MPATTPIRDRAAGPLGHLLRDWRAARGMSQMDVALRATFHPLGLRRWIVNWSEVSHHLLGRAERELGELRNDDVGVALLEEIRGYAGPSAPQARGPLAFDLLLPVHIRTESIDVRLFSTIMTLGTPQDGTLQELRIETFFPADNRSAAALRRIVG